MPEFLDQNLEKTPEEKVLEFEELNKEQWEELKERIKQHNGLIRVFIHLARTRDQDIERVLFSFGRIMNSKVSPPVFIFEDQRSFKELKSKLSEGSDALENPVYLIETLKSLPYPILKDKPIPVSEQADRKLISQEEFDYGGESMKKFIEALVALGVKKILVGGNNLVIEGGKIDECVGNFIKELECLKKTPNLDENFFDIKVSEITSPNNRSDLRGIRDDLVNNDLKKK